MAQEEKVERVSINAGGLDEHRPLTTGDLPLIAEYVKEANKSKSTPAKSKSKSKSSSGSKSEGGSKS